MLLYSKSSVPFLYRSTEAVPFLHLLPLLQLLPLLSSTLMKRLPFTNLLLYHPSKAGLELPPNPLYRRVSPSPSSALWSSPLSLGTKVALYPATLGPQRLGCYKENYWFGQGLRIGQWFPLYGIKG